jgi:hypothetical protein
MPVSRELGYDKLSQVLSELSVRKVFNQGLSGPDGISFQTHLRAKFSPACQAGLITVGAAVAGGPYRDLVSRVG